MRERKGEYDYQHEEDSERTGTLWFYVAVLGLGALFFFGP